MARPKKEEDIKPEVEVQENTEKKLILDSGEPVKVVSGDSEAHNRAETVKGIREGKVGKF